MRRSHGQRFHTQKRKRSDIIQFFGEKYGDTVRVLQIGGAPHALNGYSMDCVAARTSDRQTKSAHSGS